MSWQMIVQMAAVAGMLAAFGVLRYQSRCEETVLSQNTDSGKNSRILASFERMAIWIRKHRTGNRGGKEPGRRQVRRSMMLLYPDRQLSRHEEDYHVRKLRDALFVAFLGTVLALFCVLSAIADPLIAGDGSIARRSYDGDDQEVSLTVRMRDPANQKNRTDDYSFLVGARRYSEKELDRMAAALEKELPERILGTNRSLEHVTAKLHLPGSVTGYPFAIRWESSEYAVVDSDGSICTDEMKPGEKLQVLLTAVLSYRDSQKHELEIPVTVEVPKAGREQKLRNDIQAALADSEKETAEQASFLLPKQVDGIDLTWIQKPDMAGLVVLLLFAGAAGAVWFAADEKLNRAMKERRRQMEMDYPGILNRMVLYLGAGMSVRNVFFRLGADYRTQRSRGGKRRYAYDEILLVCRELESGQSETEAYTAFGSRCGMGQYTKLCTVLIRNLKKGNSALLSVLQAEVQEAMIQRRNLARELGEKAGTKMLFPMVVMLAVTMVLIIVPAYFGFSV